jgi:hypothetical protein
VCERVAGYVRINLIGRFGDSWILRSEPYNHVGTVVRSARVILNFIVELQKTETTPNEATLGVRQVENRK